MYRTLTNFDSVFSFLRSLIYDSILSSILLSFVRHNSSNGIIMSRNLEMIKRHVIIFALIPIAITMKNAKKSHNIYFRKEKKNINDVYTLDFFSSVIFVAIVALRKLKRFGLFICLFFLHIFLIALSPVHHLVIDIESDATVNLVAAHVLSLFVCDSWSE